MKLVLGICGSVAAYKSPWLVRDLRRAGFDVKVVLTPSATRFVAPAALQAVTTYPVVCDMFAPDIQSDGSWHVALGRWADIFLIAPCSATTLARLSSGDCSTAVVLAACARPPSIPLIVVPAMDTDMWDLPAIQRNVARLRADGVIVVNPDEGELASGLVGKGRLPQVDAITQIVLSHASTLDADASPQTDSELSDDGLSGHHVMITAGPTREAIDAVRYISNHSTGTMGYALARAARDRGARVTLISGPVHLPPIPGVDTISVITAADMMQTVEQVFPSCDVAILCAAVADFSPVEVIEGKFEKNLGDDEISIRLRKTQDILEYVGQQKKTGQIVVGFALEYGPADVVARKARSKMERKRCDLIVANSVIGDQSGFGGPDNTITIIQESGMNEYPPMSKQACAQVILDSIERSLDIR